ncbi:long-chain-fatty-acid--CoA ligase [Haloechinothrix sp. LS1_15]|uniref:long-chain-fatty-acid--CoA ligase n=1 Tax=Haloechinothrix sp. LS1_15 TaxID=2652248 RepID=UPI002946A889|nr:long-chain-fatty-acid--CoA ligase [Haloechinothrix sp. LS1_15]MDV6014142.1 AMP-binding protein [Haloechinothrix sp. LS1_15]
MTVTAGTVTERLLARVGEGHHGLRFGEACWTWHEQVRECAMHAALLRELRDGRRPFHVGVLADNIPAFSFLLGAAALAGAVLVGLNPTRRGAALARDVRAADCQLVITERAHRELLTGLDLGAATGRVFDVDSAKWAAMLAAHRAAPVDPVPAREDDLLMLIFTSGTGGDPKPVRCTHGKIAQPGAMLAERFNLSTTDTVYVAMPLFHSNAIMAGWSVALASGATIALRRKFSASRFLDDVRTYGATYANYVGTPLSYILAVPERADDADNPLRVVYGNEGAPADLAAFADRFGCSVIDGYGSTEGGVAISRTPDTPAGALGRLPDGVDILHPDTGSPCPPARFGAGGGLANPSQAIGELVNTAGTGMFAGYYNAEDAEAERVRGGMYFTGDLAYRDAAGFCYFAGRTGDWLRVGGENLGTAPIERALSRYPGISDVAVYGVPDGHVGDAVTAAIVPCGAPFDPMGFAAFLAAQGDLGPVQYPRYLRLMHQLPRTATHKVVKRELAAQGLDCADPVYERASDDPPRYAAR